MIILIQRPNEEQKDYIYIADDLPLINGGEKRRGGEHKGEK